MRSVFRNVGSPGTLRSCTFPSRNSDSRTDGISVPQGSMLLPMSRTTVEKNICPILAFSTENHSRSFVIAGAAWKLVCGGTETRHETLPQSSRSTCTGVVPSLRTKCSTTQRLPYAPADSGALTGRSTRSKSTCCAPSESGVTRRRRERPDRLNMLYAPTLRFRIKIWGYSIQHRDRCHQIPGSSSGQFWNHSGDAAVLELFGACNRSMHLRK